MLRGPTHRMYDTAEELGFAAQILAMTGTIVYVVGGTYKKMC